MCGIGVIKTWGPYCIHGTFGGLVILDSIGEVNVHQHLLQSCVLWVSWIVLYRLIGSQSETADYWEIFWQSVSVDFTIALSAY